MAYDCGLCHTCGARLSKVLVAGSDEEYCPVCGTVRRYLSHGWPVDLADDPHTPDCPERVAPDVCGMHPCPVCMSLVQPYCDHQGIVHVPTDSDGVAAWRYEPGAGWRKISA